jgi:hypothetical protein
MVSLVGVGMFTFFRSMPNNNLACDHRQTGQASLTFQEVTGRQAIKRCLANPLERNRLESAKRLSRREQAAKGGKRQLAVLTNSEQVWVSHFHSGFSPVSKLSPHRSQFDF